MKNRKKNEKKEEEKCKTQLIQRKTESNGRTSRKKRHYYNQYRQRWCCSNKGHG